MVIGTGTVWGPAEIHVLSVQEDDGGDDDDDDNDDDDYDDNNIHH